MNIVVDNLLVQYTKSGSGPTVLLLHGWGDTAATFASLITALESQYTVIALDLPGFGATQAPKEVWNLDNYAQFVQAFVAKATGGTIYAVLGHSNGGAIAIRALSLGLLTPEKLILMASAGIRSTNSLKRTIFKIIAKVGKVATFWLPASQRKALQIKLYGTVGSDMFVAEHLKETFKGVVRQDVQEDAKKITVPTLLIFAEGDKAIPLADGIRYSQIIPHAKLVTITDAGHFLHQEQSTVVEQAVKDFL